MDGMNADGRRDYFERNLEREFALKNEYLSGWDWG